MYHFFNVIKKLILIFKKLLLYVNMSRNIKKSVNSLVVEHSEVRLSVNLLRGDL